MKKCLFYVFSSLCFVFQAQAYSLTAEVDSPIVTVGREFNLFITADAQVSEKPDLTLLQKDFKVFSTSVSQQLMINNGKQTARTKWTIGLSPLKVGKQQIPTVSIGSEKTNSIDIEAVEQGSNIALTSSSAEDEYAIQANIVNPKTEHYVQEQIRYNITIRDKGTLQSGEPVFTSAASSDWIIKSLGEPEIFQNRTNGQNERLIVYKYALFPQKSGKLKIPAVEFKGAAYDPNMVPSFDPFGNGFVNISVNLPAVFNFNTPVNLYVPEKEIEIFPVPTAYKGSWWLPAENVSLTAKWEQPYPKFKEGEAVTREIKLEAVGVVDAQLPDLNFSSTPELKQYPQKQSRQEFQKDGKIIASQQINNIYIPRQSGEMKLPEISVSWFNTQTGKMEKALIPAQMINVEPAQPVTISKQNALTENILSATSEKTEAIKSENEKQSAFPYKNLLWLAVAFVLGLLSAVFVFSLRRPKGGRPLCDTRRFPDYIVKKAYQNDFRALRDGLVTWAEGFYPDKNINNLKDVAAAVNDSKFSLQIDILMAKLYQADTPQIWNAKIFVDNFKRISKPQKKTRGNNPPLPPLYD